LMTQPRPIYWSGLKPIFVYIACSNGPFNEKCELYFLCLPEIKKIKLRVVGQKVNMIYEKPLKCSKNVFYCTTADCSQLYGRNCRCTCLKGRFRKMFCEHIELTRYLRVLPKNCCFVSWLEIYVIHCTFMLACSYMYVVQSTGCRK